MIKKVVWHIFRRSPFFGIAREVFETIDVKRRQAWKREISNLKALRDADWRKLLKCKSPPRGSKRVLFIGMGQVNFIPPESILRRAFEIAGFEPYFLIPRNRIIKAAYNALGVNNIFYLDDYAALENASGEEEFRSLDELLSVKRGPIRCGKYAASTLMRKLRRGTFDFSDEAQLREARAALRNSIDFAKTAAAMLDDLRPDAAVFVDRGYSPSGEIFDACLARGIPAYTWNAAHKSDLLMLKRYEQENSDSHPYSISASSWAKLRSLENTAAISMAVGKELSDCYASGDWFGEVATQLNTRRHQVEDLRERLGLDPKRKTIALFPHIFWDATFFWGEDLFDSYEAWFEAVVREACINDKVNWIIKIHPANLVKDKRDGYHGEHSEIVALRRIASQLPNHIKLIEARTDIDTLSLFGLIDVCLTVRGTVGIEAACLGVSVLTAGTGRYDHHGFTIDSETKEEYMGRLRDIEQTPRMTSEQIGLARLYAFGTLLCRPAAIAPFSMRFSKDERAELQFELSDKHVSDLVECDDINAIAGWIISNDEDFLRWPNNLLTPDRASTPSLANENRST